MTDIRHRPISIPKATVDILLKQKEPAGLMSLFLFYYYTAIWQETNQPRATTSYAAKGLKISETRVRRYKKALIKLKMIREVVEKDKDHKITGYFIKVTYYEKASVAVSQRVVIKEGNAYSTNSKTLTAKNRQGELKLKKSKKQTFSDKCSQKLEEVIREKRKIQRKVDHKKWAQQFLELRMKYSIKKSMITKVLNWYIAHFGEKFVPVAYSAKTFCEKFLQIEDAMKRYNEDVDAGQIAPKIVSRKRKTIHITSATQGYE